MEEAKQKCACGRSLSGYCDGSHNLTNEEYMKKLDEAKKKALNENTQQLLKE
jgi:CDGSH-type Zn-finger protein